MKENHDILCNFVAWHQSAGHSDKTITYYLQAVDSLMFFKCRYFDEYTSDDMIDYQRWLMSDQAHGISDRVLPSKLSRSTVRTYFKALRTFFQWLQDHHYIVRSPFSGVPVPKKHYKLARILSPEEVTRLRFYMIYLGCPSYFVLAVELMLSCGLRASEVCNLTIDDFDIVPENDLGIRVIGKGSKERFVYLSRTILNIYDIHDVPQMVNDFVGRYNYSKLSKTIKKFSSVCMIPRLTCHLLRHTFATVYILEGGDSLKLKYILGHSSMDMVAHYVHFAEHYRR